MGIEIALAWPHPDRPSVWFAALERAGRAGLADALERAGLAGLADALADRQRRARSAVYFFGAALARPCTPPRRPCRKRRLQGSLAVYAALAPAPRGPAPVAENFYVVENFHEYGPLAYKDVAGRWVHL